MKAAEISSVLKKYDHFLVLGHEGPDGDCLGSQLALGAYLKRIGKQVELYSAGPFLRPEIQPWENHFRNHLPEKEALKENSLAVLLDCSTLDRTALPVEKLGIDLMIIDHHASGDQEGKYSFVNPSYPSTTLLVQLVIEASGDTPTKEEAELLFFGFVTDTGFFRFLEEGCEPYFAAVTRLAACGINPSKTHKSLSGKKDLNGQKLVSRIIDRTEEHFDGRLLLSWEYRKDYKELNVESRDSAAIYGTLQSIRGCEVILLLKEMDEENKVSVSFRSSTDLNVGEIAQSLGGGGHPKASGCAIPGTIKDAREILLETFSRYF